MVFHTPFTPYEPLPSLLPPDGSLLIMMNSNEKGPLHPQDLFRRLMGGDFREAECVDEASRVREQRELLVQLVVEYEEEVRKVAAVVGAEEELLRYRERLILELERLRGERGAIEGCIHEEIETLRVTPVEMREQASLLAEMEAVRGRNSKLRLRIRDLAEYVGKLELQNRRLEEERRVMAAGEVQRRQAGENWRQQISVLQRETFSYEQELRGRLRVKEEEALRSMQAQELEIKERNRVRRESFVDLATPHHRLDASTPSYKLDASKPYYKLDASTPYHKLEARELSSDPHFFRRI